MKQFVYKLIVPFILLWYGHAAFCMDTVSAQYTSGKQVLWYFPQENLDAKTYVGFTKKLFIDLSSGLGEIGYNLRNYSPNDSLAHCAANQNNLCMYIHLTNAFAMREPSGQALVVELCKLGELTGANYNVSVFRQLMSLAYSPDDTVSLRSVFVKKIVENLRTQYICNVSITSEPSGVRVKTPSRLTDVTPLEWVVPVGSLHVQCSKNEYVTLDKELVLSKPGAYSYFLQMKKKQFYNSKYFYPAIALLMSSAVCYYFDGYYYERYNRLGEFELRNSPGSFQSTFQKAKNFEYASIASLASGCCLIGLTFWF